MKINITRDQLIYELKIPLNHSINKGFFVNTTSGSEIRIGFEEGKIDRPQRQQRNREIGFGEGRGEGDEGGRGDRTGEGYGEGRIGRGNFGERQDQNSEALNTWLDVQLAGNSNVMK